jgi:hypothetical protein
MEELDPNILKLLKKFKAKPRLERSVNSLLTRRINKNKIPKYEDKRIYFSDNIDFDKAPTQEEYENYKKFFQNTGNYKSTLSNINIKESNRLKLALRYRDFFNKEGIEKSESIERNDPKYPTLDKKLNFNLGEIKNNALIERFSAERNKKLVKLINENVNFDTYSALSQGSRGGISYGKIDSFINIRNKMKPKDSVPNLKNYSYYSEEHENRYQPQNSQTFDYDKFYDRYYPENIYRTVLDTKDKDFIKVNELDESRGRYNTDKYLYHARDFNRYNLEEQLNFGLSRPAFHDEKRNFTGLSVRAAYNVPTKTIHLIHEMAENRGTGSIYTKPSTPISEVKSFIFHEGTHASEYPVGKKFSRTSQGSKDPTNPTHLSGLDAILGLTYKTKFTTRGQNDYKNQNAEFGAWFEQELLESKELGKFKGSMLFRGIDFEEENKKENLRLAKRNRISFLKSILD